MAAGDWKDMIYAIQNNNLPLVKFHIQNGVNPNYQHPEFMTTPLIESIESGNYEITKYLLEHGADPKSRAGFGNKSPMNVAKKAVDKRLLHLIQSYLPVKENLIMRLRKKIWAP